jgi:predicted nucleotidyltransferase
MQQELCDLFGRQVDLKTLDFMSDYVGTHVLCEAMLQYAA